MHTGEENKLGSLYNCFQVTAFDRNNAERRNTESVRHGGTLETRRCFVWRTMAFFAAAGDE